MLQAAAFFSHRKLRMLGDVSALMPMLSGPAIQVLPLEICA
jgi:hypothetical protein